MNTTVYYFSATGNSFDVAREIAAKTGGGLKNLVPLAKGGKCAEVTGIVFPVYDWNMPLIVRDFADNLDVSDARYIFAVATCNYLPGRALDALNEALIKKGKSLDSGFVVRMPGTYLPMYGANSPATQERKFARKSIKTDFIAKAVLGGQKRRIERSPVLLDRLLAPKMVKAMEEFYEKDSEFLAGPECSGCGICESVCPFGNIVMEGGKPKWLHKCQQCLACVHYCAKGCLEIGNKTKGKKRYKNPAVPLKDLKAIAGESRETAL